MFVKGKNKDIRAQKWDRIYITTLFTFYWKTTIDTINYYKKATEKIENVKVGGIMSSLLKDEVFQATGIQPHFGIWREIDKLLPDYQLLKDSNYMPEWNASMGFMTRGCPNACKFCAVNVLEGDCDIHEHTSLKKILDPTKKDLMLLDNNVLGSKSFPSIIEEIKTAGFERGNKSFNGRRRYVDFNQGVDARLLTEDKMKLLSQIEIKPLRIAFDNIRFKKIYIERVLSAKKHGITHLSNFVLFNFNDSPDDFYERLRINVELNAIHDLSIFSFPMKFVPLNAKDRKQKGEKSTWTPRELRGLQLILHATHGVVGSKMKFFDVAFGRNVAEFKKIINTRPEEKILYRSKEWMSRPFEPQFTYVKNTPDKVSCQY